MDTSLQALTRTINKLGEAFEAFKSTNDERVKALEAGDTGKAGELAHKLGKIEAEVGKLSKLKGDIELEMQHQKERIEELESRQRSPGRTGVSKRAAEYKSAFVDWIRNKGQSAVLEQRMQDLAKAAYEAKDITIGTPAAGGFAVPEEIAREIERLEQKLSPVRRLVKVVPTGTSDYKELVNIRGATSGWVGESGSRTATNTPQLRERTPTHGELYAYPQVSEWSLDDIFFNVEQWLAEEVAEAFAIDEGDAVIRGDGTNKPTGMLNTTPTTADDFASPLRAAAVYQYVASLSNDSPPVAEILSDALIDLVYKLNSMYRAGATWVMNSTTTGAVRKLKDLNGQYLWQPGLQMGQPERLLGYPVETWEQMDDIGTNKFPVAFGNFRRGYVLTDRVGLRITRDNISNVGFVRFYVRRREGGCVLNNDAIKFLRTTVA
jgi:HK97 family phage major capsid protein